MQYDFKSPNYYRERSCCFPLYRSTQFVSAPFPGSQTCIRDPFHQLGQTFLVIETSILLSITPSTPWNKDASSPCSFQMEITMRCQIPDPPLEGCSPSGDHPFSLQSNGPWHLGGNVCSESSPCHRAESKGRNKYNRWYPHIIWCQGKH